ncbi:MAG: hypothetical protein AAFQ89_16910 [Cyanobacteria bacterium J06626_18]
MPEDPTPPDESTPQPSEAEWTDDIDSSPIESDIPAPTSQETSPDAWEQDALDWEDELTAPQEPPPQATSTREALAWLAPVGRWGLASWRRLLVGVRSRIPAAATLSDPILSGILLGGLALLLVLANGVRQPSVAADGPTADMPVAEAPTTTPPTTAPATEADPTVEPPIALDEPTPTPIPEPPAAELELDPAERDRMAAIQTQLTSGALSNGNGLVESVQADFSHNQLTVNLTNGWYRLSTYEQEELANTFKQRSGEMAFDDVELRSPDGNLLARSPVVGDNMIILQHEKPPVVEPLPRPRYRITVDR